MIHNAQRNRFTSGERLTCQLFLVPTERFHMKLTKLILICWWNSNCRLGDTSNFTNMASQKAWFVGEIPTVAYPNTLIFHHNHAHLAQQPRSYACHPAHGWGSGARQGRRPACHQIKPMWPIVSSIWLLTKWTMRVQRWDGDDHTKGINYHIGKV